MSESTNGCALRPERGRGLSAGHVWCRRVPIELRTCTRACRGVTRARRWFAPGLLRPTAPGLAVCRLYRLRRAGPSGRAIRRGVHRGDGPTRLGDRGPPAAPCRRSRAGADASPVTGHGRAGARPRWSPGRGGLVALFRLSVGRDARRRAGPRARRRGDALRPRSRRRVVACSTPSTARAAERGYDRLALNVHIRNPATRLYSRAQPERAAARDSLDGRRTGARSALVFGASFGSPIARTTRWRAPLLPCQPLVRFPENLPARRVSHARRMGAASCATCPGSFRVPSRQPGVARPRGRSWAALDAHRSRPSGALPTRGRVVALREVDGMARPPSRRPARPARA